MCQEQGRRSRGLGSSVIPQLRARQPWREWSNRGKSSSSGINPCPEQPLLDWDHGRQREVPGSCTHSAVPERDTGIRATSRLPEQLRNCEQGQGDSV